MRVCFDGLLDFLGLLAANGPAKEKPQRVSEEAMRGSANLQGSQPCPSEDGEGWVLQQAGAQRPPDCPHFHSMRSN